MKHTPKNYIRLQILLFLIGWLHMQLAHAQASLPIKPFRVKDNVMYITFSKKMTLDSLLHFIQSYSLNDVGLFALIKSGQTDSVEKSGWRLASDQSDYYTLSKALNSSTDLKKYADRLIFSAVPTPENWHIVGDNKILYGVNKFKNNQVFEHINGVTYFFLKGYAYAHTVKLAGNFTNWQHSAFPMTRTEEGWVAAVQLQPGQYFYKFIIDGRWITDPVNELSENDGYGNINSVYFVPNKTLFLPGYQNATSVSLTGSFINWSREGLPLERKANGWQISLYLEEGTHKYQFIVDGVPVEQKDEKGAKDDEQKLALGTPYTFTLKGYISAHRVALAGNFNDWNPSEIFMKPTPEGWTISYVLGPGNYQYKFIVDGRWMTDPGNPHVVSDGKGNLNSFRVIAANYTFRLKGFENAKEVFLSGEFNNWSPTGLPMTKQGKVWVCPIYLSRGKHLYKFVVDGQWIRDPQNPLWEDDDENSVLWIE